MLMRHRFGSDDIFRIAEEAESVLEKADIGKRYRAGAEYVKTPNVTRDRALRYQRLGTSINIKRRSKGWVLSSAQRKMIFPSQRGNSFMSLSNRQKEIVLHNLIVKYWISAPTDRQISSRKLTLQLEVKGIRCPSSASPLDAEALRLRTTTRREYDSDHPRYAGELCSLATASGAMALLSRILSPGVLPLSPDARQAGLPSTTSE